MMSSSQMSLQDASDADLVALCLAGNLQSFGDIVERYQSLICSLAYSATGDLGQSEDLAQETFFAAWRNMGTLREPSKLRAWLCGIARHLISQALRDEKREPAQGAVALHDAPPSASTEEAPGDQAISREEQALLWRSLERMPSAYREVLILYYREQQSVEQVSHVLDLSEEAVRQRLSRGRKLLQGEMMRFVESALRRSAPGRAFTLGVLAALPMLGASTSGAVLGAGAIQGTATAKAGATLGWLGAVVGPVVGILAGWWGAKAGLEGSQSDRERRYLIRIIQVVVGMIVVLGVTLSAPLWLGETFLGNHPVAIATGMAAVSLSYVAVLVVMIVRTDKQLKRIREEDALRLPRQSGPATEARSMMPFEYRSRSTFLGLPWIHVRVGNRRGESRAAVGWVAVGDRAVGVLFAFGGWAVGLVSLGGFSVGLIALGGAGLGVLAVCGVALGACAVGGVAVGYLAAGGVALAWQSALGGLAVAWQFAQGGSVWAQHANDAAARQFMETSRFMRWAMSSMRNGWFNSLVWLPMLLLAWQTVRMKRANAGQLAPRAR